MELLSFITIVLGAVVGIVLTSKNIGLMRSLTGSFFKKSYLLATLASSSLFIGYTLEAMNWLGAPNPEIFDVLHHIFLFVSGIAFFSVAIVFPKEVGKALEGK